jgi:hypothetical protein
MTTTALQIPKAKAIALFNALGLQAAAKWNLKRMAGKLAKIDELVDEETTIDDVEANTTCDLVLKAIEDGQEIEVVEGEPEAAAVAAPAAAEGEEDSVNMAEAMKPDAKPKKKAATKKAAGTAAAPATPKEPKPAAAPKTPGVRETRTRPFLAGIVIREAGGLEKGVTDAMVQKLDKLYGKENPAESQFCLKNAWHAIRGFQPGAVAGEAPKAGEVAPKE